MVKSTQLIVGDLSGIIHDLVVDENQDDAACWLLPLDPPQIEWLRYPARCRWRWHARLCTSEGQKVIYAEV